MTLRSGLLKIFKRIIFLKFRSGWPGVHETQAASFTFHDRKKILGKEAPVRHLVDGSVAGGTTQVTGDDFHGARLYIIVFQSVHIVAWHRVARCVDSARRVRYALRFTLRLFFWTEENGPTAAWLKKNYQPAPQISPSGTTNSF